MNPKILAVLFAAVILCQCTGKKESTQPTEDFITVDDMATKEAPAQHITPEIDPYEKIHIAFEGFPDKEKVKPMMEEVMNRYEFPVTNDNILKFGNMLVAFKNDSKVGVTEMQILKHMYQKGSSTVTLVEQAAISATVLEENN